jgi:hypothetical protein
MSPIESLRHLQPFARPIELGPDKATNFGVSAGPSSSMSTSASRRATMDYRMYPVVRAPLERQGVEDLLPKCQGGTVPGQSTTAMELVDGWRLRSYSEPTIIMCGRRGCWCRGSCTTMLINSVAIQTMVTVHLRTDRAAAMHATEDVHNLSSG